MLDSLKSWHAYFTKNRAKPTEINWDAPDSLTADERICIKDSIAAFQLGEYSEGKGLMKAAGAYAARSGDDLLVPITKLFIAEEQNHALLLKSFMNIHDIPLMKKNWTDDVFRRMRKNVGYELSITVLIMAEIISLVYYRALRRATNSKLLRAICDKILSDEAAHVRYESEVIDHIRSSKPAAARWATESLHRFLFFGTTIVVYLNHKRVLNRGGCGFYDFCAACWAEFSIIGEGRAQKRLPAEATVESVNR
ncbi:MAG TPA: ferritin-like domain-containing protein [Blastocatellia bacterium]|nr:ferritin-like domain-containing protein [Blastocatellia bacterium]